MGWFKKKADPISDRARSLNQQIAALEAQIKQLGARASETPPAPPPPSPPAGPKLRSTALPHGAQAPTRPSPPPPTSPREPIFEEVDQNRLQSHAEPAPTPEHFNELGVRKYDLAAFLRRIINHFRGPSTANPKLVNYLAAGSLQGLRPMRYEKRVERNRFLAFFILLMAILLGIFATFFRKW